MRKGFMDEVVWLLDVDWVAAPPIPLDVREVNMYEDITVSSKKQICSVFSKHSRWLQGSDPLSPLSLILAATSSAVCDSNFIWSGKHPHALGRKTVGSFRCPSTPKLKTNRREPFPHLSQSITWLYGIDVLRGHTDLRLSGMIVISSDSSMAAALTCLDALFHGGPEAEEATLPFPVLLSSQKVWDPAT
ncbi:hypothetical protein MJG53_013795 [Ovis ammon polii x Ovis aries]|uniref:Uncharacterized protein n=1 Tax=Ovis ammon polii x Ovis aries TaxID=2918886 RepID=A0ACB9UJY1_9CETA|nr:hypothetical protein MJG53_013795 [Ovis ammon polii x Ovis aries]